MFQAKLIFSMDESNPNPAALNELRSATDLALHAIKMTAQAIGRSMASGARAPSVVEPDGDEGCG